MIAGIDIGTSCGYAVISDSGYVTSGRWRLRKPKEPRGVRWLNFERRISNLVQKYKVQTIVYERVRRHVGTTAAHVYGGFLASVERLDYEWQEHWPVFPATTFISVGKWKKLTIGKGNASKKEVQNYVESYFKIKTSSADESDALGIALAFRRMR